MRSAKVLSLPFLLITMSGLLAADDKKPVPKAEALTAAEKTIKEVFKDEYAKTTTADKLALAQKLLEQAGETKDDVAARYVLYQQAIDLATQAGDLKQAFKTADELAKEFAVSSAALKVAAVDKAAAAVAAGDAKALVDTLLPIIDEAVAEDEYEAAARIAKAAETAAKKAKTVALISQVQSRAKDIDKLKASFEKVQVALTTLTTNADDAGANLLVGRHYCFVKGDWDKGLTFLVKGSDANLKALAQKDIALPTVAADQLAVADGWYDLAAKESPKTQLQLRAHYWYKEAVAGLTGISKTKAEKRLAELDKVAASQGERARVFAEIRKQIADKKLKKWDLVGGAFAKDTFEEVPAEGGILIGFRYTTQGKGNYPGVVQPIWQTARGTVYGKVYGTAEKGAKAEETKAKAGYAVGAIYARGGGGFDAFKPIYMKMTEKGLDPNDKYDGPHIGGKGGGEGTLGADGNFIVGLHGKIGNRGLIGALSPVTLTVPLKGK
jgi:tetratricopeptide (TPR) repeat protein